MDIRQQISAFGRTFGPEQVKSSMAMFAPLLPLVEEAGVKRNVLYGYDLRHRLNVFGAGITGGSRPVLVFIHGGGFVMGDTGLPGEPFYNNIGAWAARQGWIGVVATYRLAPQHSWPSGAQDVAAIIEWVRANIGACGGDADKIVLIGQSAGAAHVASYVGIQPFAAKACQALAGAVMMSGLYDIEHLEHSQFEAAYYGTDVPTFAAKSSLTGLAATDVPCLFTVSEYDPEAFQRQAALVVAARVAANGYWPDFAVLEGQNHITPVHQIGSAIDAVGPIISRFVDKVCQAS